MSVLTSAPRPLLAVPAVFFFRAVEPGMPVGLGFACGAMLYIVLVELLPEGPEQGSRPTVAWGSGVGHMREAVDGGGAVSAAPA